MSRRFVAVQHVAEQGFEDTAPTVGAKLVADWANQVADLDLPGAKGLHDALGQLRRGLGHDEPHGDRIKALLGKIGPATVRIADRCADQTAADKVRALTKSA